MSPSCQHPRSYHYLFSLLALVTTIFLACAEEDTARLVQRLVKEGAFRSLGEHPRTGLLYSVKLPPRLAGVDALVVRYRSGSLRRHGGRVGEFRLPRGLVVHPYVERLVAVQSNLGNLSSAYDKYCNAAGYRLVSPVLSLLVYNAARVQNLSTTGTSTPELDIAATGKAITVDFSAAIRTAQSRGDGSRCATFGWDGRLKLFNGMPGNLCATRRQGRFALVTASRPALSGGQMVGENACRWKMVVAGTVGGLLGAALLGLLCVAFVKVKKRREVAELERRAYEEEMLQVSMVGHVRAPTAGAARTAPAVENDYVPQL